MGKSKNKSQQNDNKKLNNQPTKPKHYKRVESSICEKCNSQCREYEKYAIQLTSGKAGYGVVCKKD